MGVPTSSSSAPSVVAAMLDALDVQPGQQVLEIGTGTGWNAALLCELVGDADRVTTIEVDPVVAAQARKTLGAAGYEVRVVVGDGAEGFPALAPYDRIIATCAVWEVPHAWLTQVRDGGIIVTPWSPQRFGRTGPWPASRCGTVPPKDGSSKRRRSCGCAPSAGQGARRTI